MRCNIVHPQAAELVYEIRRIVEDARRLEKAGVEITWENIGDPVAKGERVPEWIVEHLIAVARDNRSWGYSPSKGMSESREYLASLNNARGGAQISPESIYFFNGLGDAISKLYRCLNPGARVLSGSPSYPISGTYESFCAKQPPICYHLDPARGWLPDLVEIRAKVKENPQVAGIQITNPDNPTGLVWPKELIQEVVELAGEYGLFVISDETYHRLSFSGRETALLAQVIGGGPGFALKGISKEYPWPGSRCGWMEFYNEDSAPEFKRYIRTLLDAKMLEVCATTQPQMTIPRVMADPRYPGHLKARCAAYGARAKEFEEAFRGLAGVHAVKPEGAFYAVVSFEQGALNAGQRLNVENAEARKFLEGVLADKNLSQDKRFVFNLLAASGICVVPLTGFHSQLQGFRMTLLEQDDSRRAGIYRTLREKVEEYLGSA